MGVVKKKSFRSGGNNVIFQITKNLTKRESDVFSSPLSARYISSFTP